MDQMTAEDKQPTAKEIQLTAEEERLKDPFSQQPPWPIAFGMRSLPAVRKPMPRSVIYLRENTL